MDKIEAIPQALQDLLQPGEQLAWWESPHKDLFRDIPTRKDIFTAFLRATIVLVGIFAAVYLRHPVYQYYLDNISNIVIGCLVCYIFFTLLAYLKIIFAKKHVTSEMLPPYWEDTLYAVTNQRAMVVIGASGANTPTVIEYLPHEINTPILMSRSDGAGIVIFGEPHEIKPFSYEIATTLQSGFFGIPQATKVISLLEHLKAKDEQIIAMQVKE
jgi:hypothetical protein